MPKFLANNVGLEDEHSCFQKNRTSYYESIAIHLNSHIHILPRPLFQLLHVEVVGIAFIRTFIQNASIRPILAKSSQSNAPYNICVETYELTHTFLDFWFNRTIRIDNRLILFPRRHQYLYGSADDTKIQPSRFYSFVRPSIQLL